MKTKNGVELDIKKSNYKYYFEGMTFYFSSEFYLNKYKKLLNDYIRTETIKIYNKYKILCDFKVYLSLSFYRKIEKRGFYVIGYDGLEVKDNTTIISDY